MVINHSLNKYLSVFYIPCNLFISSLKYLFSGIILKINLRVWFSHHAESLILFNHFITYNNRCLKIIPAHARLSSPDSENFLASYSIIKAILFSQMTSQNYLDKSGILHVSVLKQFIRKKRGSPPCLPDKYLPKCQSQALSLPLAVFFLGKV